MLPTDTRKLRQRFFVMVAGGPGASLILGVGALLLARTSFITSEMPLLLTVLGLMSMAMFLVSMVPITSVCS